MKALVDRVVDYGWRLGPSCHLLPLSQSAEDLDLLHSVAKMIGLKRAWFQLTRAGLWPHYDLTRGRRDAALKTGQVMEVDAKFYVRTIKAGGRFFKEEASGILCSTLHYYIMSDSGSCYTAQHFQSSAEAIAWWDANKSEVAIFTDEDATAPKFISGREGWEDLASANVLYGADLLEFQAANPI